MPPDSLAFFAVIALGTLVAGLVQGALGFGYGIVAVLILPWAVDLKSAHVLVSLSGVPSVALAAWASRAGADWRRTGGAIAAGAVCLPVGLLLFNGSTDDLLTRGTGGVILVLMLLELRGRREEDADREPPAWSVWAAGGLGGFLAGAVSIGGPPIAAYAMRTPWPPIQAKAFLTRCLLVLSAYKAAGLWVAGLVTPPLARDATWAAAIAIAGTLIGNRLGRDLPTAKYRRLVAVLLVAVSAWWLIAGA